MAPSFLHNKVCLITGGTQGLGWAIAQTFARQGGKVYACGLSASNLARAQAEAANLPYPIHLSQCDVTKRELVESWIGKIYADTGRIDILVNNAAYVRWTNVLDMSVEEAEQTMNVAYHGMVYTTKAVLPLMIPAGTGHIVNIGSITGSIFVGGASAAYSAAKAAIDGYSQILQVELKDSPVSVMLVRPGTIVGTDFFKKHVSNQRMPRLLDFLPYTTPPQVAQAIIVGLQRSQKIITIPWYLRPLRLFFALAPALSRRIAPIGGQTRRDYRQLT